MYMLSGAILALLAGCAAAAGPPTAAVPTPAVVVAGAACMSTGGAVAYVAAREPSAEVMAHLTGAEAASFLRRLNDMPPVTQWTGDEAMMFTNSHSVFALIVLFTDGCATLNTQAPIADVMALLEPEGIAL